MAVEDDIDYASGMSAFESKHFSQAMQFLSVYADQGHAESQHHVAIMYQNGLGMAQNDEFAVKWMRAAAEQGHALACEGNRCPWR